MIKKYDQLDMYEQLKSDKSEENNHILDINKLLTNYLIFVNNNYLLEIHTIEYLEYWISYDI